MSILEICYICKIVKILHQIAELKIFEQEYLNGYVRKSYKISSDRTTSQMETLAGPVSCEAATHQLLSAPH